MLLYTIFRAFVIAPVQYVISFLFRGLWNRSNMNNHNTFDGLAPAVTAKAAQVCISYLQSLAIGNNNNSITSSSTSSSNSNSTNNNEMIEKIGSIWMPYGFQALKQEAYRTKSLMVVYIHSPLHSNTHEYCSVVLNSIPMLNFLQQPQIVAAAYSIHTAQGYHLQSIFDITTFPAIVVLQPNISQSTSATTSSSSSQKLPLQILIKAQGMKQCRLASIMPYLHAIYLRHVTMVNEIEMRHIQRQQEQELRQQQDMEYMETLAADQERERQLLLEKQLLQQAETQQQQQIEQEQQERIQKLQRAKDLVRPEPTTTSDSSIASTTMIRFILPSGMKINRRFYSDETIASLRAYLYVYFVEQNPNNTITNIGLSTNLPPRQTFNDIDIDNHKTLIDANLIPQAVLMVQDLDA